MNKKYFFSSVILFSAVFLIKAQVPADSVVLLKVYTDSSHAALAPLKTDIESLPLKCYYHVKPVIELPLCAAEAGGALTGLYLLSIKKESNESDILNLNPDDLSAFNRPAIHQYNRTAADNSDIFLYGGCAYGLVLLMDRNVRADAAKIGLMYLETMLLTGITYTLTAGNVYKYRPYAWNTDSVLVNGIKKPEVPMSKKITRHARDSFYGGHPAAPAAAGFFVASVFSAYHPHSPFRFVLYGVAAASTLSCAYLRYAGGQHFPTDLLIGMGIGTTYGLLIPRLHNCKNKNLKIEPMTGSVNGLNLHYTF